MYKILVPLLVFSCAACQKSYIQNAAGDKVYLNKSLINPSTEIAGSVVTPSTADFFVRSLQDLTSALKIAVKGQSIYIADDAVINLNSLSRSLYVPAGITLASGLRFNQNFSSAGSKGARLYLSTHKLSALIRVLGDNVRITGLRIYGPDRTIETFLTQPITCGIKIMDFSSLIVEHCEIAGWSYAGVNLINSKNGQVTNCYIHHNRRKGLGYGILLDSSSDMTADRNLLDNNRHSIAGTGHRTQSYEIKNSIIRMSEPYPYSFSYIDMHGESEMRNGSTYPNSLYAGKKVYIHHNSIRNNTKAAIVIRGIPLQSSYIQYNTFDHASADEAIIQYLPVTYTKTAAHQFILFPFTGLSVSNNTYKGL